jgi:hypothetical protein
LKRERVERNFVELPDAYLPMVAERILVSELPLPLDAATRIAIQDMLWVGQGVLEIPKRTRREIAQDLDLVGLVFKPDRLPAALLAELGMSALWALVFLAIVVLAVICWVIASGDRTDRVSQMMLARRGEASFLAPGTAAPSTRSGTQAGRPDRPVPGMRKLLRPARPGDRCP